MAETAAIGRVTNSGRVRGTPSSTTGGTKAAGTSLAGSRSGAVRPRNSPYPKAGISTATSTPRRPRAWSRMGTIARSEPVVRSVAHGSAASTSIGVKGR